MTGRSDPRSRSGSRLKHALRRRRGPSSTVTVDPDRVVKQFESRSGAQHAMDRLGAVGGSLPAFARVPIVLDVRDRSLLLERVHGPTLWEVHNRWLSLGALGPGPRSIVQAGALLGHIHRAPLPSMDLEGALGGVFRAELARALGSPQPAPSDLVFSHGDFGPINLIVDGSDLVVLDPEANGYVTVGQRMTYSAYVDLGTWLSAVGYRGPIRNLRAVRSLAARELALESITAYESARQVRIDHRILHAHAQAAARSYLRAHGLTRLLARAACRQGRWPSDDAAFET